MIVYFMFYIFNPYRLAFREWDNPAWIAIDAVWDFFFLIDIILTFFKAYYDKNFLLRDKRKRIAQRYLTTWFWIDLIGILPIYYVFQIRDYPSLMKLFKIIEFPRSFSLNRIFKTLSVKFK